MKKLVFTVLFLIAGSSFAGGSCPAADVSAAGYLKSAFIDLKTMNAAMTGNWAGCDVEGNPVKFSFNQGMVSGTLSTRTYQQRDITRTFTGCNWTGRPSLRIIDAGEVGFSVNDIVCKEGSGRDNAHGDVGTIYAYGGADRADLLVLEFGFRKYAVVRRAR